MTQKPTYTIGIDPGTDLGDFTIARLERTMSELEKRLREMGPALKRVRMAPRMRDELRRQLGAGVDLSSLTFHLVPVVFDLPDSDPVGFKFVYEA